ncbi:uncharacterized protein LOC121868815 isoform X2 [Homarus americanus]|nr:uncharacterized protein LOC121868815 isoform X2 [Homarus americanus]
MKTITMVILLLGVLNGASAWVCYQHDVGSGSTTWQFCPSGSCFSVGASIIGIGDGQKGCADKVYPAICQNGNFEGLVSEHVCFCNSFLCNSSSLPSIFLPLLVLSYLLLKLM